MTKLKQCPFCGGGNIAKTFGGRMFVCRDCNASTGVKASDDEAVKAWNIRPERTCQLVEPVKPGQSHRCSECGGRIRTTTTKDNYCPNCGAKVVDE